MLFKQSKYKNKKVVYDNHVFDSKKEFRRYNELLLLKREGSIKDLEVQPRFDINVNGKYIGFYKADFAYKNVYGERVVEDVKSTATKTPVYRLKKKLVESLYPIEIKEVC